MKLEKIKLAGFKSFVDPTQVAFPSNLVGVVGPNGCGKSNVIDAVRWVMGESSAKMLRGESMADVIFNGSTGRKPVGVASIELVFDNADGSAGGQYAAFNQISVKRQVARDGQSAYFLNGTRCRRRDIQDLFLGTGLGPRSYAIIEQGMISRIIEARPEDLRLFLEEAAGISKYKERRRETETRMRHTRENLARLDDLREEVAKQLQHLERQAETATKYRQLKADEQRLDQELKALRWRALDQRMQTLERQLAEAETTAAAGLAEQRRIEAEIEAKRDAQTAAVDTFNAVQAGFYAVGAEIARAEQAIKFANEERGRREAELVRLEQELHDAEHHLKRDRAQLTELDTALAEDTPELSTAEATLAVALDQLAGAEAQLQTWEGEWDGFNRAAAGPAEQAQVERARINGLEQGLGRDRERLQRLDDEIARLRDADVGDRLEDLVEREEALADAVGAAEQAQQRADAELAAAARSRRALAEELAALRTQLQETKGRQASLQALQEAALQPEDGARAAWLAAHGWDQAPALVTELSVAAGWEQAVETFLGGALGAVGVPRLPDTEVAEEALPAGLTLIEIADAAPTVAAGPSSSPVPGLLAKTQSAWPLTALLAGVRPAEDLALALAERASLAPGERFVTPRGTQIGANWLTTPPAGAQGGVLARAETLKALAGRIAELLAHETALLEREQALVASTAAAEQARTAARAEVTTGGRELSTLRAELSSLRTRREHQQERLTALHGERAELEEQTREVIDAIESAREHLHELLEQIEALAERREAMTAARDALRAQVATARAQERACRQTAQTLQVRVESNRAARAATAQSLERALEQQHQLRTRRAELTEALEAGVEPLEEQRERLDAQLGQRIEVEEQMRAARERRDALEAELRQLEQARQRTEQGVQQLQRGSDALRLDRQDKHVRRQTLEEQLAADGTRADAVLAAMSAADLEAGTAADGETRWQEALAKLAARIQRLGAVNLAAIDELKEQSERKTYLDAQHQDITRALDTLEQAIRKIDRETRNRFKETYDAVDRGFQQIFPRLFGGGHAYLELTGEDLLETGVSVMARPPGKRNSSIQLLSGGEKALTAVALVFAIFELNPAPFCMLDEVDAPLDDANVGRFCELVRSMSDRVQFIFITHNKVTMEIADQLIGVTMHEPGVSRLVSVDVEAAARLAAAS